MGPIRAHYDVVIAGGGPVGCVAAAAFARRGADVLVLEADPRAAKRFAGEWIHPMGVGVLDTLRLGRLERAAPRTGYGFVIVPGDRSEPIEMPYPSGVALACPHDEIVACLREAVMSLRNVTFVPFARVVSIAGHHVVADERKTGQRIEVTAGRIVGADGRSSSVRRALGLQDSGQLLSYMASVELRGAELPFEGFGHVILGGPGPALLYRIGADRIRACLDLPVGGSKPRSATTLWDTFSPVLPPRLLPSFRRALSDGPVVWAATRFRPRSEFGSGAVTLAGDALGHLHPMTAMGLTLGFLDAEAAAKTPRLDDYATARRSYVPELLSNALYHCFRREDATATEVRGTMFRLLRASAAERRRTMEILGGREQSTASFGSVFLRIAASAIGSTTATAARTYGLRSVPGALLQYTDWLKWPAAGLLPRALSDVFRAQSTATQPIPLLGRALPENETRVAEGHSIAPIAAEKAEISAPPAPQREPSRPAKPALPPPPIAKAMTAATDLLISELEGIALKLGKVPDDVLGGPAMRMMRAITATQMRSGVAARMMIGRRRLTTEGMPRLLGGSAKTWSSPVSSRLPFETSLAAELLLVLLDGTTWVRSRITGLDEGIAALLARQTEDGGFSATAKSSGAPLSSDMEATVLSCRALAIVVKRLPGTYDARIEPALRRASDWLRAQQADDGAFAPKGQRSRIALTAWTLEALAAAEGNPHDPAVRRAARWLLERQAENGAFYDGADGSQVVLRQDAHARRDTARALRALLASKTGERDALLSAAALIATALADGRHKEPCIGIAPWEECSEALYALACYESVAREPVHAAAAPKAAPRLPGWSPALLADFQDCRARLADVSRSFAKPIALLPLHLEVPVTLGYLLCRVADTIEDHRAVPQAKRDTLFAAFLDVLHGRGAAADLAAQFAAIRGDDAELALARNLPVLMRVMAATGDRPRASLVRWVSEMARGMALYAHREPGADGVVALYTVTDLERYCYFVAGTVGHLLTDLFLDEIGKDVTPDLALTLRLNAEPFGTGLQLVNILKDLTDDRERSWSYVPRTACFARGADLTVLSDPSRRALAHSVVEPLFDVARRNLDGGLRYSLAIPPEHTGIRLFCLLPLWMAARTLVLARGNDAMFTPGEPVKIARDEVEALAAACATHAADNDALAAEYAALWDAPPLKRRSTA